jgi:hypothetical protein
MKKYITRNGRYVFYFKGELTPEEIEVLEKNQDVLEMMLRTELRFRGTNTKSEEGKKTLERLESEVNG